MPGPELCWYGFVLRLPAGIKFTCQKEVIWDLQDSLFYIIHVWAMYVFGTCMCLVAHVCTCWICACVQVTACSVCTYMLVHYVKCVCLGVCPHWNHILANFHNCLYFPIKFQLHFHFYPLRFKYYSRRNRSSWKWLADLRTLSTLCYSWAFLYSLQGALAIQHGGLWGQTGWFLRFRKVGNICGVGIVERNGN